MSWFCALKLETLVHLTAHIVSRNIAGDVIPGKLEAMTALQQELEGFCEPSSVTCSSFDLQAGKVDDWWATFEWSSGGMAHVHIAFWIVASPRIDKIVMSSGPAPGATETTLVFDEGASVVLQDDVAAKVLTKFYDRVYSEWNPFKKASDEAVMIGHRRNIGNNVEKTLPAIDMISSATLVALLETDYETALRFPQHCWSEVLSLMQMSSRELGSFPLQPPLDKEEYLTCVSRMRHFVVALIAEWVQMHDFHEPFASGPPSKSQACAKTDHEHSCHEKTECGKLYPRKVVPAGAGEV